MEEREAGANLSWRGGPASEGPSPTHQAAIPFNFLWSVLSPMPRILAAWVLF